MQRKEKLPELLAPAGSPEVLYAAVEAGANAVYLGVNEGASNARVGAVNFSREEIASLVPYCHAHGVKMYVTLNTLCYDKELAPLTELAKDLDTFGVDGLIVADLGLARAVSLACPTLPLHASTQTFCHSLRTANALYRMGFSRVVLARETSEKDMAFVTKNALPEIEVFVHGALCVCHSGECLFSSLVGGRSGNRGACAQPCRLPYGKGYPLSLKDLCLAAHIPSLIEMGVASLKIEGRMKAPSYAYEVTRVYRRLLDEGRGASHEEMAHLERVFSRDGFTDGYFTGHTAQGMTGVRRERDKAATREIDGDRRFLPTPAAIRGEAVIAAEKPATLTLTLGERSVTASGDVPSAALNAALTEENVRERLSKLGGTPFAMEEFSLQLDEGLFLPVGAQNALRRKATDGLQKELRKREINTVLPIKEPSLPPYAAPIKTALFYDAAVFAETDTSLFDLCFLSFTAMEGYDGTKMPEGIALPPVCFDGEEEAVLTKLTEWRARGVTHALVSSLGGISFAKEAGLIPFGDLRLNVTNKESARRLRALGLCGFVYSAELPSAAAQRIGEGGSITVYGRLPLMLTERCFVKENFGCDKCGKASLTDRMGICFPLLREYSHRMLICNSLPTYLGDREKELRGVGHHFIFTVETASEIRNVLTGYLQNEGLSIPVRRGAKGI